MRSLLPFPDLSSDLFKAVRSGLVKRKVQQHGHNGQLSLVDRWVLPTPIAPNVAFPAPSKTHQSAPKGTKAPSLPSSQMSLFGEGEVPAFKPKPRPKTAPDGGTLSLFGNQETQEEDSDTAPVKATAFSMTGDVASDGRALLGLQKLVAESIGREKGDTRSNPKLDRLHGVHDALRELHEQLRADPSSAGEVAKQVEKLGHVLSHDLGIPVEIHAATASAGSSAPSETRDKITVDEAHHYEEGERVRGERVEAEEVEAKQKPSHPLENHPNRAFVEALTDRIKPKSKEIRSVQSKRYSDGRWRSAGMILRDAAPTGEEKTHWGVAHPESGLGISGIPHSTKEEAEYAQNKRIEDEHAGNLARYAEMTPDELQDQRNYWVTKHPDLPPVEGASIEDKPVSGEELLRINHGAGGLNSLGHLEAHMANLHSGDIRAETHKAAFASLVKNKDAIVAELKGKTKAELDKIAPPMWSGRKKDEAVKEAWNKLAGRFHLGDVMSWSPMSESHDEAVSRLVGQTSDDDIQTYNGRRQKAIADHKARVEAHIKALKNPESREEFDTFARLKGEENLSSEQREKYDELRGVSHRETKRAQAEKDVARALEAGAAGSDPGLKLVKHFHTKFGQDVHIATLDEKVEREHFDRLVTLAKTHGGWYSRPWKGSPSGFAFKTEEGAKSFMESAKVPSPQTENAPTDGSENQSEDVPKSPEQSARDIVESRERDAQLAAAAHLRGVAESLHGRAQERLDADRKTNTARRVRMAEGAEEGAERDQQLAATMHSIASDLEEGKSAHLAGVKHKTHVELLAHVLNQARWHHVNALRKRARDEGDRSLDEQAMELQGREPGRDSIEHVALPHMVVSKGDLGYLAKVVDEHKIPGAVRALAKIRKNCLYKPEWKEHGQVPIFRQDNLDALDALLDAVEKSPHGASVKYDIERLRERRMSKKRLEAMGIPDLPSLRAALREFLPHRPEKAARNPIKQAERALVGGAKIPGYFPTPVPLAQKLLDAAGIADGHRVLEPSAGKGSLADAIKERHPGADVEAIEPNSRLRSILEAKGHKLVGHDFLLHPDSSYDRIVMNPPFENGQDADHVRHAFDKLKPGGRLVAITGEGIHFRSDAKAKEFRRWLDANGGTAERLPDGSFKSSDNPTGVATRMVVLNKPGAFTAREPDQGALFGSAESAQAQAEREEQKQREALD